MKKNIIYCLVALLLLLFSPLGCSNNDDPQPQAQEEEKSAIDKMNEQIAHEIVDQIQTPINKAQAVKQQQEERWEEVKEGMKE